MLIEMPKEVLNELRKYAQECWLFDGQNYVPNLAIEDTVDEVYDYGRKDGRKALALYLLNVLNLE